MRDRSSGQVQAVTIHAGGCALALADRYDPITSVEDDVTKASEQAMTEVAEKEAAAAAAAAAILDAAPGPVPAVADEATQEDATADEAEVVDEDEAQTTELPMITTRDIVEWIRAKKPLPQFDPEDVARAIAWEIISAPSLEQALEAATVHQAKEFYYQPLRVNGVKWQPSDEKYDGLPFYAVLASVDPTSGEPMMVTCGGMNVCASMVKADLSGEFPITVQLTEQETRGGFMTLKVTLVKQDQAQFTDADGNAF